VLKFAYSKRLLSHTFIAVKLSQNVGQRHTTKDEHGPGSEQI